MVESSVLACGKARQFFFPQFRLVSAFLSLLIAVLVLAALGRFVRPSDYLYLVSLRILRPSDPWMLYIIEIDMAIQILYNYV